MDAQPRLNVAVPATAQRERGEPARGFALKFAVPLTGMDKDPGTGGCMAE